MKCVFRVLAAAVCLVALAVSARACSVPVFRFALERWPADPYPVLIFHDGELSEAQRAVISDLGSDGLAGALFANVYSREVDVRSFEDEQTASPTMQRIWDAQENKSLPRVVIQYPLPTPFSLWSGSIEELAELKVTRLIQSPVREQIAERILKGHTGVFLLLESGDAEQDDAAARLLAEQLKHLQTQLKLPEIDPADLQNGLLGLDPTQLRIEFSMLRVKRDDPAEQFLVRMLRAADPMIGDLQAEELRAQPMVFPIFGRGRVLYALVGRGINEQNLTDAGAHLVQSCTCEIKEQNPGMDLLMAVDWENLIQYSQPKPQELPPLAGLAGFTEPQPPSAGSPDSRAHPTPDADGAGGPSAPDATAAPSDGPQGTVATIPGAGDTAAKESGEESAPAQDAGRPDGTSGRSTGRGMSLSASVMMVAGVMVVLVLFSSLLVATRRPS